MCQMDWFNHQTAISWRLIFHSHLISKAGRMKNLFQSDRKVQENRGKLDFGRILRCPHEQWKNLWLFRVYRGWNSTHLCGDYNKTITGWWFQICLFSPLFGEDFHFDEHIFQMSWNRQPVKTSRDSACPPVEWGRFPPGCRFVSPKLSPVPTDGILIKPL